MNRQMRSLQSMAHVMLLSILICLLVAGGVGLGLLNGLELQGYDLLVSTQDPRPSFQDVVIVDFDDKTLKAIGMFPIPRGILAEVVDKIAASGPALIGLDLIVSQRREPAQDQRLADTLARAGNIILVNNFGTVQLPASEPLPEFREHALDIGFINMPVDEDGLIRRMFLWMKTPNFAGLSFPVVLASNYLGRPLEAGRPGTWRLGSIEIPVNGIAPNSALIGSWSPRDASIISAELLLIRGVDEGIFKQKIVLIGQSNATAKDLYATPLFRFSKPKEGRMLLSGTEIHAAALVSLLTGNVIGVLGHLPQWSLNFLLIVVFTSLVISLKPIHSIPGVLAGLLGTYYLAQTLFSNHQAWMKFVSAEIGIVLALPFGLGYRFLKEQRLRSEAEAERQQLMSIFEKYVSPEVAVEIWHRRNEIILSGEERTATVLFSDIRDFTALTAGKHSAQVLQWLNEYFTAMSEIIKENSGLLNKFIGDGMLVVFGVPISQGTEKDACRAVNAALQMLRRIEKLNARQPSNWPRLTIGIGLHTGSLTAGNVGAKDRLEYSVIGETVNLASRLETLTKILKTKLVMSPQTQQLVRHQFETISLGNASVRGFPDQIQVYTVASHLLLEEGP